MDESGKASSVEDSLKEKIEKAADGLYYISETDADILPFIGDKAEAVSQEEILKQTHKEPDAPVEERDFSEFFERLTKIQDWFEEEELELAKKFSELKSLLEENLTDLKVFKIGQINIDIYVVGIDQEGVLMGVKTQAVET